MSEKDNFNKIKENAFLLKRENNWNSQKIEFYQKNTPVLMEALKIIGEKNEERLIGIDSKRNFAFSENTATELVKKYNEFKSKVPKNSLEKMKELDGLSLKLSNLETETKRVSSNNETLLKNIKTASDPLMKLGGDNVESLFDYEFDEKGSGGSVKLSSKGENFVENLKENLKDVKFEVNEDDFKEIKEEYSDVLKKNTIKEQNISYESLNYSRSLSTYENNGLDHLFIFDDKKNISMTQEGEEFLNFLKDEKSYSFPEENHFEKKKEEISAKIEFKEINLSLEKSQNEQYKKSYSEILKPYKSMGVDTYEKIFDFDEKMELKLTNFGKEFTDSLGKESQKKIVVEENLEKSSSLTKIKDFLKDKTGKIGTFAFGLNDFSKQKISDTEKKMNMQQIRYEQAVKKEPQLDPKNKKSILARGFALGNEKVKSVIKNTLSFVKESAVKKMQQIVDTGRKIFSKEKNISKEKNKDLDL